jgi:hypothetical protein
MTGGRAGLGTAPSGRRARMTPPLAIKAVAFVLLVATSVSLLARGGRHDWRTGDTIALVNGLPGISRCLQAHVFTGCNSHGGAVSAFALLQMLPAYALYGIGISAGTTIGALAWLNALVVVAFCAIVVRWAHGRGGLPFAVLIGLVLIPGMLIPYTAQSFGEPLAAAAFGLLCVAALRRDAASIWLAPLAFAATISKDTAAPFVILFAVAAVTLSGCDFRTGRRSVITIVAGTLAGLILATAFNLFRYDSLENRSYLDFPHATKRMAVNNFFGLLVSPNGGIAWFWPGVIIAAAVLVVLLIRGTNQHLDPRRIRAGAALSLAAFVGSVCVLALWWQPYGWYAWGPRLLMPVAPAVIVLALSTQSALSSLHKWLSAGPAIGLGVIALLTAAPAIGVVFHWQTYTDQIVATWARHPICQTATEGPGVPDPVAAQLNTEQCIRWDAWETDKLPLVTAVSNTVGNTSWYWSTYAGGAATILVWIGLGSTAVRRKEPAPDEDSVRAETEASIEAV